MAIPQFESTIKVWNKEVFGNIFHHKQKILYKLDGIQKSKSYPSSFFLQDLEKILTKEFISILRQEHEFWRLKSRITWLDEGDANTKFFHNSTLNKRIRNRVNAINDNSGN